MGKLKIFRPLFSETCQTGFAEGAGELRASAVAGGHRDGGCSRGRYPHQEGLGRRGWNGREG